MEIIDKKEETLQLVLTEKGREKLSKSMFKPHSYAFYDNEIIYDNSYNNKSEEQNLIQPRIKKTLILGEKVTWDDTKKEWVGLTDKDIEKLWGESVDVMYSGHYEAIKAIEEFLKKKNT